MDHLKAAYLAVAELRFTASCQRRCTERRNLNGRPGEFHLGFQSALPRSVYSTPQGDVKQPAVLQYQQQIHRPRLQGTESTE